MIGFMSSICAKTGRGMEMAKFCGKCGTRLNKATGLCPNCDSDKLRNLVNQPHQTAGNGSSSIYQSKENKKIVRKQKKAKKKEEKKVAKEEKRASWSFGKKVRVILFKLILLILLLAALVLGSTGALVYYDMIDIQIVEEILDKLGLKEMKHNEDNQDDGSVVLEDYRIEPPDAEEYFKQNSDVLSEMDVNDSKDTLSESEAIKIFDERGFEEYPVTTEYNMDGEYSDAVEVSELSTVKHPIYQSYYVTENNEIWVVLLIDGDVIANPVSYNMQSTLGVQVIISESDAVTSYDGTTNKFYKNIPDQSALIVKVVEKITAESLEKLTIGAIDKL